MPVSSSAGFTRLFEIGGLLAFVVASPTTSSAALTLYGVTFTDQLITINTATGAGSLVGSLDTSMAAYGLGVSNGNLYAYDQIAERIRQLDPATGHTVATININTPNFIGEGDLVFRADGTGFIGNASNSSLSTFSLAGGTATPLITSATIFDGLAFNSSGVLYGLSQGPGSALYTINQSNGVATLVGALNVAGAATEILGGLDFAPDGTLYAELSNGSNSSGLYTVNVSTGQATLVGQIAGFGNVSGIRFLNTSSTVVPEPASMAMVLGGLATTMVDARIRRRAA